jgi:hypothetical protein
MLVMHRIEFRKVVCVSSPDNQTLRFEPGEIIDCLVCCYVRERTELADGELSRKNSTGNVFQRDSKRYC